MMKHATWIPPRSAITVFRFSFCLANFSTKRHTLIRVRLRRLGCPPCASPAPRLRTRRSASFPSGEPAVFGTTTGLNVSVYRSVLPFSLVYGTGKAFALASGESPPAPMGSRADYTTIGVRRAIGSHGAATGEMRFADSRKAGGRRMAKMVRLLCGNFPLSTRRGDGGTRPLPTPMSCPLEVGGAGGRQLCVLRRAEGRSGWTKRTRTNPVGSVLSMFSPSLAGYMSDCRQVIEITRACVSGRFRTTTRRRPFSSFAVTVVGSAVSGRSTLTA